MTRERLLLVLEILFVLVIVAGVAMVSVPSALVLGGLLGVLAVERATVQRKPKEVRR
ncbi:hypothetical protein [Streptomyces sp. NPDC002994]|uniref:hypothetical protein n=1 Tax=Streptomyces sp. NPDC002994 TaxID=3154441 RepID=UPI0033B286C1